MDGNFTRDSKRRGPRAIKASDDAVPIVTSSVSSNEKPPDKSTSSALRFNLKDASSKLMSTFGRSSKRPDPSDDSGMGTPPLGRGSKAVTPTVDSIFKEPNNSNNSGDSSNNNNKNKTSSLLPPAADVSAWSPTLGKARDLAKDKAASKEEAKLEIATPAPAAAEAAPPSHMTLTIVDVTNIPDGFKKVSLYLITVVSVDGDSWKLARRYNHFHALFTDLQAKTSKHLPFPPKKFALSMDESKLKQRTTILQRFLDQILLMPNLTSTMGFARFVDPMENPSVLSLSCQDVLLEGKLMMIVEMPFNQMERHERFVMIVSGKLFYFKDENAVEVLGSVSLDYCVSDFEGEMETGNFSFSVKHLTMARPILFEASEETCKKWVSALRQARLELAGGVDVEEDEASPSVSGAGSASSSPAADNSTKEPNALRRFARSKSVRLSTFASVVDTVSSLQGSLSFSDPDSEENLILKEDESGKPVIVAASIEKLIEKLTDPEFFNKRVVQFFLLTYRASLTPQELLAYLLARYHHVDLVESRKGFRGGGLARNPVHDRICIMLEMWLDVNFPEFLEDANLTARLMTFVFTALEGNILMNDAGQRIKNKVKALINGSDPEEMAKREAAFLSNAPNQVLPNLLGVGINYLMDIDPLEFARQVAILDHELLCKVHAPVELVGQKWSKDSTKHLAANVMNVIARFNSISSWVIHVVLEPAEPAIRAAFMTRFIDVAEILVQICAFGPACAIIGGLLSPPLMRLKKTAECLTEEASGTLKQLQSLIEPKKNHKYYRTLLAEAMTARSPCCPYLGLYLADLTFIEDGNQDLKGELINFEKRSMIAKVLSEIMQIQATPYCLKKIDALQYFLQNQKVLGEAAAYKLSLEREPREAN
jgi:hypothetical protein